MVSDGASPCPYARQIRSPHRGQGPWCPSPRCRRFGHVGDHDERKKPGQPRRDDRSSFDGLIWLARTGSPWPQLPREFGARPTVHHGCSESRAESWSEPGQPTVAPPRSVPDEAVRYYGSGYGVTRG
jgi:hypothetical protein